MEEFPGSDDDLVCSDIQRIIEVPLAPAPCRLSERSPRIFLHNILVKLQPDVREHIRAPVRIGDYFVSTQHVCSRIKRRCNLVVCPVLPVSWSRRTASAPIGCARLAEEAWIKCLVSVVLARSLHNERQSEEDGEQRIIFQYSHSGCHAVVVGRIEAL